MWHIRPIYQSVIISIIAFKVWSTSSSNNLKAQIRNFQYLAHIDHGKIDPSRSVLIKSVKVEESEKCPSKFWAHMDFDVERGITT